MIQINLQSIQNIRDLGNTAMKDGRIIRPGCLIRSAHLGNAEQNDLNYLRKNARLNTVIDLRTVQERYEVPDQTTGLIHENIPIFETFQAGITHERKQDQPVIPDISQIYRYMMKDKAAQSGFYRVLKYIFEHDYSKGSILWHCTEGKDRCGMVTALVLTALGADRDTILADYLTTNETNRPKAEKVYEQLRKTQGEEAAQKAYQIYIADERYLQAAWEVMGDQYLEVELGFTINELAMFREKVLY